MFEEFLSTERMKQRRQLHRPEEISSSAFATKGDVPLEVMILVVILTHVLGSGLWSTPRDVGLLSRHGSELFLVSASAIFKLDEVCHVGEFSKSWTTSKEPAPGMTFHQI